MNKERKNKQLLDEIGLRRDEAFTVLESPDYDEAIVGVTNDDRVVYDYNQMAECLMKEDGMEYEEAVEFIDFNTVRALPYMPNSPVVVYPLDMYDAVNGVRKYNFDAKREKDGIINWIREWFERNGPGCTAVIGLSGGKDSTIAAALCVEALGKDRVIGVALPDTLQGLNGADKIAEYLGIRFFEIPIGNACWHLKNDRRSDGETFKWSEQTVQNIPPRIRMAALYAVAQTFNGRVVGTCNLSENYIGYFTKYGDGASDFEPLGNLTVTEVRAIGHELGLPFDWVEKIPDDGLPHSCPDEEKLGYSYETLDKYIRFGECNDPEVKNKIDTMHAKNAFKMRRVEFYWPKVWE